MLEVSSLSQVLMSDPEGTHAPFDPNKLVICREVGSLLFLLEFLEGISHSKLLEIHITLSERSHEILSHLAYGESNFFILLFTESSIHSVSCSILFISSVKHLSYSSVGSSQIPIPWRHSFLGEGILSCLSER